MTRTITASLVHAGETVPMPPVFGPRSPSKIVLWSSTAGRTSSRLPSVSASTETSRPAIRCSITSVAPAAPNWPRWSWRTAARASAAFAATTTPLPAASPSALTTTAPPRRSIAASASSTVRAISNFAVGIPWRAKNSFENAFEPSTCAPAAPGPNVAMPRARSWSASPATSGASGPTTTRSTASRAASARMASWSSTVTGTQRATRSIPGLPGAATSSCPERARRQQSACSRPPAPMTRIFTT